MALDETALRMLAPLIRGASVLSLAYPDLLPAVNYVEKMLGITITKTTENGPLHKRRYPLAETCEAFLLAGAIDVLIVDLPGVAGANQVADLNCPQRWDRLYDVVINPGTIEHCFNVGEAFFNAWRAVAVGGHALHVGPISMVNHGFWNICPTAFVDFALDNGGEIVEMCGVDRAHATFATPGTTRFGAPIDASIVALLRKRENVPETWPTQTRYRR